MTLDAMVYAETMDYAKVPIFMRLSGIAPFSEFLPENFKSFRNGVPPGFRSGILINEIMGITDGAFQCKCLFGSKAIAKQAANLLRSEDIGCELSTQECDGGYGIFWMIRFDLPAGKLDVCAVTNNDLAAVMHTDKRLEEIRMELDQHGSTLSKFIEPLQPVSGLHDEEIDPVLL